MPSTTPPLPDYHALRARAVARITGEVSRSFPHAGTASALKVLFDLASSPATAENATALLHELQVHQVEVDLQAEELRRGIDELQNLLARQMQLYEAAPVAYVTLERDSTLREVNQAAMSLFGLSREHLIETRLTHLLDSPSRRALQEMFEQLAEGGPPSVTGTLTVTRPGQASFTAGATAARDPGADRYLLVLART